MKNIYTILTLIILAMVLVAGCNYPHPKLVPSGPIDVDDYSTIIDGGNSIKFVETSDELMKFSSTQEVKDYLLENSMQQSQGYSNSFSMMGSGGRDMVMMDSGMAESSSSLKSIGSSGAGASDYSETNVQVEGVDEPDFVKNDNKYIYLVKGADLYIADVFPGENADVVSRTRIGGSSTDLFLKNDKLIVLANNYEQRSFIAQYDFMPRKRGVSVSHAYIYDISDRSNPELISDFSIDGNYYDARMIGNYVYFISQQQVYYDPILFETPVLREGNSIVIKPEIYYFPNPETNYNFNTITSLNIEDAGDVESKTFMMGYSNTLYVSEDNIYISYRKNVPWHYHGLDSEASFYDVVLPLLPSDVRTEINEIKNDEDIEDDLKWSKISEVLENMYNEMDEDDKEDLVAEIQEALEVYQIKQEIERSKTIIHRIAIDDGEIEYGARGEVSGSLLNQFSLDEFDGNLRVATTTNIWAMRERQVYNNVFILNEDMKTIGEIEDIAPGERIYSTRFVGDRLYMVTFKNIDPLFVIDLSNPTNPKILGELKIPGYSTYLHPYDENHIIGVGVTTEDNQWGGISTSGLKIAMFDVTDVENPKEIDKYEIGERGTYSTALYEHKAFLFDKEKGLLVLPVREVTDRYMDPIHNYYRDEVWNGAYVFDVDEGGFDLKGKVEQSDDSNNYSYRNFGHQVLRSIFMDDNLYTVSLNLIRITSLIDLSEMNEVKLD